METPLPPATPGPRATVEARTLLLIGLAGLIVLALVAAYLLGGARDATADAAETPAKGTTVTMVGEGTATVVPDQLAFTLSTGATRPDLDDALAAANDSMGAVLTALGKSGVPRRDIQTSGLSMDPVYDYPQNAAPVLRGYRVRQESEVLVRDLEAGGGAVSAVVAAGGNAVRVGDLRLRVGDPEAALADARAAAVEQATAKARAYVEAAGQELGDVRTLREVPPASGERPVPESLSRAAYAVADSDVPLRAGRDELAVEVEVVWALR